MAISERAQRILRRPTADGGVVLGGERRTDQDWRFGDSAEQRLRVNARTGVGAGTEARRKESRDDVVVRSTVVIVDDSDVYRAGLRVQRTLGR